MYIGYFHGVSQGNPGAAGIGCVLEKIGTANGDRESLWQVSEAVGEKNSREAEYMALIKLFRHLAKNRIYGAYIRSDHEQTIKQLLGKRTVLEPKLWLLFAEASELAMKCRIQQLKWIPTTENKEAERLARAALSPRDMHM